MLDERAMLRELGTGRVRPLRRGRPVWSCAGARAGFAMEEHAPMQWESRDVSLMVSAVYLLLDEATELEWVSGSERVTRRLLPGQVSILPANHPYSARLRAAGGTLVVSLEHDLLACASAEQGMHGWVEPVWTHGVDDSLLRELILALRNELQEPASGSAAYARSLAGAVAARVVRRYSTDRLRRPESSGGLSSPALRSVVGFILDHLGEELSVERIAEAAQLSAAHFARQFKRATGLSPHRYVLRCRVSRARELMADARFSLAEIASQTGFCDQGHMTRAFRQVSGTTPGAVARRMEESPA